MRSRIESSAEFSTKLEQLLDDPEFLQNEIFRSPAVRDLLTLDRFRNLFDSKIQTAESTDSSDVTVEHNTDPNRMFFDGLSKRPDLVANVLSSLNSVRQNAGKMKVLSVGARTEAEVFSLVNAGFPLANIECVDLFTYTPLIKVGDIHDLDYEDDSFDVTMCGWVLEFCSDLKKACSELIRVTKPGGYIAIAGMHHPVSTDFTAYNQRKHHEDRVWYCSIDKIKEFFSVQDADFVFKSDIEEEDLDKRGEVVAIFKTGGKSV